MNKRLKFKYTKTADETKMFITILCILLGLEIPIHIGLWFLRFPWDFVSSFGILLFEGTLIVRVCSFLFTTHQLREDTLFIHAGSFVKTHISLSSIQSCALYTGGVPEGELSTPGLKIKNETAFVALSRKNLVKIELHNDHPVQLHPKKPMTTAIVLSLDEPSRFVDEVNARLLGVHQVNPPIEEAQHIMPQFVPHESTLILGKPVLEVNGVRKRFKDFKAVSNISFTLHQGEILGLVGRNGAGKTTLMNMLAGETLPTEGEIQRFEATIGYVPDSSILYEHLSVVEFLNLVCALCNVPKERRMQVVEEQLESCHLEKMAKRLVRSLSLGMRRRLSIAASLIQNPNVLILDEVTNGLDPVANREVKEQLRQLANRGCAIILSSHILDLIADLAHRVAIMEQGQLVYLGEIVLDDAKAKNNPLEDFYLDVVQAWKVGRG